MNIFTSHSSVATARLVALLTVVSLIMSVLPLQFFAAQAQTIPESANTVEVIFEKKFSGPIPDDLTADDFAFEIEGNGTLNLTAENDGYATASIELEVGEYDVSEVIPHGQEEADWRIQWSSACDESDTDNNLAVLTITEEDLEDGPLYCRADNQYRPICTDPAALNFEGTGDCEYPPETCDDQAALNFSEEASCEYAGEIEFDLEKKFSGPVPEEYEADQFTFNISSLNDPIGLTAETVDTAKATVTLGVGTYVLSENGPDSFVAEDWVIQWTGAGCENLTGPTTTITIEVGDLEKDNFGCRADNQWKPGDNNGGNENGSIQGYKWNDLNRNGVWEDGEPNIAGWSIVMTDDAGATTTETTDENGKYWFTDLKPGVYTVCEEQQAGWTQTAPVENGGCYEVTVASDEINDGNHFGNYEEDVDEPCEDESDLWADTVESSNQGLQTDSDPVLAERSNTDAALGVADWSSGTDGKFFSLGFGGSIVVSFEKYIINVDGDDLSIHEATNGDYPLESAKVEVSQNGSDWYELTEEATNDKDEGATDTTLVDFDETGLEWVRYVRITDTTNPDLHNDAADGFDLDAVDATYGECDEPITEEDTYLIEGYVWHDDNENKNWDGSEFDENVEQQIEEESDREEPLQGWTVKITNGEQTYSTTTTPDGYYYFEVPAGTWTISEVIEEGWDITTPDNNQHVVTVPEVVAVSFVGQLIAMIIPTAHAAIVDTYGFFNFGNNEEPGGGGSGGGGGGGSASPRCQAFEADVDNGEITLTWDTTRGNDLVIYADGVEIYTETDNDIVEEGSLTITEDGQEEFELVVSRGSRDDDCSIDLDAPAPQVLGDQVSIVPQGAPDTGAGGTAVPTVNLTTLIAVVGRQCEVK